MTVDPYEQIDAAYTDAIAAAVAEHDAAVAGANAQLAASLANSDDLDERASILAAFDDEIAPARDAFHAARDDADGARETAKAKGAADHEAARAERQQETDAEAAKREALAVKLRAGNATPAEQQKAVAALLDEGKL